MKKICIATIVLAMAILASCGGANKESKTEETTTEATDSIVEEVVEEPSFLVKSIEINQDGAVDSKVTFEYDELDRLIKTTTRRNIGTDDAKALADALLLRPRVLLLDDFLAGLDGEMRDAAGPVLSAAAAFSSVIATGHELDDLAKWATRFFVLRDGVISASVSTAGVDRAVVLGRLSSALRGGAA